MQGKISNSINELLVTLFHRLMSIEEKAIITDEFKDISNNDMHIIEAIGIEEPRSVSNVASRLDVTVGTLNIAMNRLEKKGYIERNRSEADKRVVLATLTEKGKNAFFHHRDFHKKMIRAIVADLSDEEMQSLYSCLNRLMKFFREYPNEKE